MFGTRLGNPLFNQLLSLTQARPCPFFATWEDPYSAATDISHFSGVPGIWGYALCVELSPTQAGEPIFRG